MKGLGVTSVVIAAASFFAASLAADVDPIVIKGSKFFYKTNGTEFFMKGIAYQQDAGANGSSSPDTTYKDPLTDVDGCRRDIPYLQQLSTNTIRVYAIDPTKDHTECMQMLQDAGIYLVADLSVPNASIIRDAPAWNSDLYNRYTSVIDALQQYPNVLGFFAGNEVANNNTNLNSIPFVKAAVRDTKAYIKQKGYRTIGVGYAADDHPDIRTNLEDYLNCGPSEESIDFFGYNIYSWCGQSSFQESGYADRTRELSGYSVPAFFAEYGCNEPQPRLFEEVEALYSDEMTGVWSGGIVYMYFQETNDFGLVSVDGNAVETLADFSALSSQIAKVTPSGLNAASYTPTNTVARACPTEDNNWTAASVLPPTPNEQLCQCMMSTLTCVAQSRISEDDIGDLFGQVCDPNIGDYCSGITTNGTTGAYGAYSPCNATAQLSFAFNAYYQDQIENNPGNTRACDFNGAATTQAAASASGACASLVDQAGPAGTGSVGTSPGGTGSGSGGGASTTTRQGSAGMVTVPSLDFGMLQIGIYITVAALSGAGMILL